MDSSEPPQTENALPHQKEVKEVSSEEDICEEEVKDICEEEVKDICEEEVKDICEEEVKDICEEEAPLTEENEDSDLKNNGFTLCVGNLNADQDYCEIKSAITNFFSDKGLEIQNVRLTRTKKCGYVDLASGEELQKALQLNGSYLMGHPLILSKDKKKGEKEHKKVTNLRTLFVKNLPYSVKQDELKKVFNQAIDIEMPVDTNGSVKGYAFVKFESVEDAAEALKTCNKMRIMGRCIEIEYSNKGNKKEDCGDGRANSESPVTPAKRKADREDKETPSAKNTKSDGEGFSLLIDSMIPGMGFREMKSAIQLLFSEEGIKMHGVHRSRPTEFGYVDFASEEDLQKALKLNGKLLMGQPLKLDRATYKENVQEIKERNTRTLLIKNLPSSVKQDDLKEIFQEATDIRLLYTKNGFCRGIAFVVFATEAIAEKMMEAAQGSDIRGNSIFIDYAGEKSTSLLDTNPSRRILAKNLSSRMTEESLRAMFEKAVAITIPYKYGRLPGCALVEFESVEDAKEALKTWNYKEMDYRMVRLSYMTEKKNTEDEKGDSGSPVKTQVKRKTDTKDKETPPAKKAKSDGEEFILSIGNLNQKKDVHEIKSAISHFFSNEGLKIKRVRLSPAKKLGYVDFASEEELQKALELDGKNLMGQPVKIDRARGKDDFVGTKASSLSNKILVVHNLSYSVTVDTLRCVFDKAVAIRIPQKDGKLQRFAFVQFESVDDAEEALENCNNIEIDGRIVHIEISKSNYETGGGGMGNSAAVQSSKVLLINNLSMSVTKHSLWPVFGKAVDIRIPQKKGKPIGFGFVEFKSVEDAKEALETCNHTVIDGRSIRLEFRRSREDKDAGRGNSAANSSSKAKNMPFNATKDFPNSVPEKSVSIKIPLNIGNQKGCAFMEFTNVEDAIEALKNVNKAEVEGKSIVQCHKESSQMEEGEKWTSRPLKTLFVNGLSEDTTDQTLKDAFDRAVSARIITDRETGSSKGFGYVEFDSEEDCKAAREAMDDCEINGKKVTLDYALPKREGGQDGFRGRGRGGFVGPGRGRTNFGGIGGGRGVFGGRGGGRGGGFGGRSRGRGGRGGSGN